MADTSTNLMNAWPGSTADIMREERLKGYGGAITPTLSQANARSMAGGGSVMDLESQQLLLGQGAGGSRVAGTSSGLILNTYV